MNQLVPVTHAPPAPSFTMSEMERVALAIAKGRLFGSDDPNAVLTLCMVAQAEGKHPGLVLQQYHIISGKPAKKAEAMLVDFLAAGGRVVWEELTDERVSAKFSHPMGGEVTIDWTIERATKAGLLGNATWKKYPRQMLRSRVVSEGVRTVFPGATSGLYVPEEVMDFAPDADTPPTPQARRGRDMAPEPVQIELQRGPDYSEQLARLKAIATPGNTDALGAAWKEIGADARKALAAELPALKAACEPAQPADELVARMKSDLAAAADPEAVETLAAELEKHRAGLDDKQQVALEVAIDAARKRVSESAREDEK